MMLFYGRTIILFHLFSSESKNFKMFTHFDLKMVLSFAIKGSIKMPLNL